MIMTVVIVEMAHFLMYKPPKDLTRPCRKIPLWFMEFYRICGYFTIGALFTLLTAETAKFTIGRFRPHFLTICNLNFDTIGCKDSYNYEKFVTEYTCDPPENITDHDIKDAKKSFLSGHSSFSFYCATFLAIYLQLRLSEPR